MYCVFTSIRFARIFKAITSIMQDHLLTVVRIYYDYFLPLSVHDNDLSGPRTGLSIGSFREARYIAIDGDDGDGPGGVVQEDGLIMRGRQHVYRVQGDGETLDREKLDGREKRYGEGREEGLLQASL